MPSAVPIFLKIADEKQVIYFTWPNNGNNGNNDNIGAGVISDAGGGAETTFQLTVALMFDQSIFEFISYSIIQKNIS